MGFLYRRLQPISTDAELQKFARVQNSLDSLSAATARTISRRPRMGLFAGERNHSSVRDRSAWLPLLGRAHKDAVPDTKPVQVSISATLRGIMKKCFFKTAAAAAIVMSTQAAWSADVSVPTLFWYWNGAYTGLQGGWGWTTTRGLPNATGDFGGGLVGYNYQMNNLVFGVEGEGSFANISGQATDIFGIPTAVGYRDDGLASLRGRLGFAFDNFMLYGTAGGGWGHGIISATTERDAMASGKAWHAGWAAGGGIEYGFMPTWTIKLEYLHYGLGNELYFGRLNTGNVDVETFRIGVNYIFR